MHYLKLFSNTVFALGVCGLVCPSFAAETLSECLETGKQAFSSRDYSQAKTVFTRCLKLDADNVDAQLSLAGVLLTQDDLNGAEKYLNAALRSMPRNSPYWSYTYSMLGDIALKRQQNAEALKLYAKSLEYNAANVNSLVGKGVIVEYQGDKKGAAEYYRSALAVEPLNLIARRRLVNLEPFYLTDEEILAALKQRYAVEPDAKELTDEKRKLFTDIHRAEQRRGVDYLKNKLTKVPAGYITTLNKGTSFERDMLTLDGYNALEKHIGQDAIAVFQKAGVPVTSVFELRDMKGEKIFTEKSTLTPSGFYAYTEALKNRKAFLLPNEAVPPSAEQLAQIKKREQELKDAGYVEISYSELKMIENKTKCSEETLRRHMGLYLLPVTDKTNRYFIIARKTRDPKKGVPFYYLRLAESKKDRRIKVPKNSWLSMRLNYGYTACLDDGELFYD